MLGTPIGGGEEIDDHRVAPEPPIDTRCGHAPKDISAGAYATRRGIELGLPERLSDWTDTHALRALIAHGHDVVGNLLLGRGLREALTGFLSIRVCPLECSDQPIPAQRGVVPARLRDPARRARPGDDENTAEQKTSIFAYASFIGNVGALTLPWVYFLANRPFFGGDTVNGVKWVCLGMSVILTGAAIRCALVCRRGNSSRRPRRRGADHPKFQDHLPQPHLRAAGDRVRRADRRVPARDGIQQLHPDFLSLRRRHRPRVEN